MNETPSWPDWLSTVHHDGSANFVSIARPRLGDRVRLRLRLGHRAPVRQVYLRTFPDGEQAISPMQPVSVAPPVQWWEGTLPVGQPTENYRFILVGDDGVWHYGGAGPTRHVPLDYHDFRLLADYDAPAWTQESVFYQIFPDRFRNGDPGNDPRPQDYTVAPWRPHVYGWESPPAPEDHFASVFYGGDLIGVRQSLPYLAELGVNALYLNPVFTALSNHRYDVIDYEHVDPHLGGDAALAALRRALDRHDMRYLLDIVPNHCGYWHPWFQAARADSSAPEARFFTFTRHPDQYASWLGVPSLVKLNYRSRALRQRIYAGEEAVFRRWLRPPFAADGWRVDVANMLGRQGATQLGVDVARGVRRAVKETRADAYLLGENFFDATASLQNGDQWDGVMNYAGFGMPLLFWLTGYTQGAHGLAEPIRSDRPWPTAALAHGWRSRLGATPWSVARQQYNLLGSHDTPRVRTLVGENDALNRLAVVLLFTFPGVPGVYYGDEVGMTQHPVLASRGCMIWDEGRWDQGLRAHYRSLIRLRRDSDVLQTGGFQVLLVDTDTISYQREGPSRWTIVVAHRAQQPRPAGPLPVEQGGIPDGAHFVEFFSGQEATVADGRLWLPDQPQGAGLWQSSGDPDPRGSWFEG